MRISDWSSDVCSSDLGVELHDVLHSKLDLDDRQKAQIELLEQRFAVRRRALELELRADNARLADAIETEHGNGPGVAAAVEQTNQTLGQLQKEKLGHIFPLRQHFRPKQHKTLDNGRLTSLNQDT